MRLDRDGAGWGVVRVDGLRADNVVRARVGVGGEARGCVDVHRCQGSGR